MVDERLNSLKQRFATVKTRVSAVKQMYQIEKLRESTLHNSKVVSIKDLKAQKQKAQLSKQAMQKIKQQRVVKAQKVSRDASASR